MTGATTVRVSEIAQQIRGVTYVKEDASKAPLSGYLPILRAGNITDEGLDLTDLVYVPSSRVSPKQVLARYDVVVAASSGSLEVIGKAAQVVDDFAGSFGAFCKVLRPSSIVHPRYFLHFFRTPEYRRQVSALATGANINNLRGEHLDDLELPFPSLKEQERIAEVLDHVDVLRAKRRETLALLDELTQSLFLDMFGDPTDDSNDWATKPFGEVVQEFRYGTSNKSTNVGFPALRIPNVVAGELELTNIKTVPVSDAEFRRLRLVEGDLLFVRTNGNPNNVGRCAVFAEDVVASQDAPVDHWIYASYLIRARLDGSQVLPVYVREFMLGKAGRKALLERSKTSAGQFNINVDGLGSIMVPIPPIDLQERFARQLNGIGRLRRSLTSHLAELQALFHGLQYRAFRGEL